MRLGAAIGCAALVMTAVVPANAEPPVNTWRDGWRAFGIAIRGAEMAAFGGLPSAIAAPSGRVYFPYHGTLYRVDPDRRSFRRDRALPPHCWPPVIDTHDAAWCIDRDTIVGVDARGARRAYRSPLGAPSSLAVDGDTVLFTAPPHAAYGELTRGRFSIHRMSTAPRLIAAASGQRCLLSPDDFTAIRNGTTSTWHVAALREHGATGVAAAPGRCYAVRDDARGSHVLADVGGRRRQYDLALDAGSTIAVGPRGIVWLIETKLGPPANGYSYTVDVRLASVSNRGLREMHLPVIAFDDVGGPAVDRAGRIWLSAGRLHAFSVALPPAADRG